MAAVKLVNLTKRYGEVTALDHVNLEIAEREFLVLVGPSGCGKTTCLRIIAGLDEPSSGEVWIGDLPVNHVSAKDRDIAMVFQNYALYPHMSVFDNMAFGLKLQKVPGAEVRQRVQSAAEMLGIEQLLQRRPAALSGGQRQRVALGRAVVREPSCFLMDEPLSNLDAKLRLQTRAELIRLHRRLQITTIYVTHDQVEAMTMGDRIAVMNEGIIQQCDTPLGLYNRPVKRFVAGFIGSPPMNFIEPAIEDDGEQLWVAGDGFRMRVDEQHTQRLRQYVGREVIFGIRPTDIREAAGDRSGDMESGRCLEATVEVTEPTGAHTLAYLDVHGHSLLASLDSATEAVEGRPLEVTVDMSKCHYFDMDTEESILLREAEGETR